MALRLHHGQTDDVRRPANSYCDGHAAPMVAIANESLGATASVSLNGTSWRLGRRAAQLLGEKSPDLSQHRGAV